MGGGRASCSLRSPAPRWTASPVPAPPLSTVTVREPCSLSGFRTRNGLEAARLPKWTESPGPASPVRPQVV